ncbi:hypothetical protein NC651_014557 [Populus alba x Populus x berolinensis]|nr:hypothetical protein NC651_014557 [Populus alba x Populus x berolinensis]
MAACHIRSTSLPSRSHPLNVSVEDQLDRLRSSQTTSTSVYHKLSGLKVLYECVEDFLQLPLTQQTLSNEQQKEMGEEVLSGSLLLLDMCSTTRDVFSSMKECLQELESSLRRRKGGESGFASEVEAYTMSRKQLDKTIRKCFKNLKSMEKNITSAVDAVSMLREVKEISLEIFQSLLSMVSQTKARSSSQGWSVVSKLFQSKRVSCEAELNEFEKIDAELLVLKSSKDINSVQVQNTLKGLEALESTIQEAEEELEAVYRKLLKTRDQLPLPFNFVDRETEVKRDANTATLISSDSLVRHAKMVSLSRVGYVHFSPLSSKDKMAACHIRSTSLPSRSHPLNVSVEDQLDRLRSSQPTSTSVYHKLSGLKVLYECVEDFLQLPSTQQTLSNEQQKEMGEEVLSGSLLLLDMCSATRDVFSSMKECLQELESSLRRRKGGESGFASEVEAYMMSRKQLDKTIRKCLKNLKSMEKNITSAVDAVSLLTEVKEISLEIFQSLLSMVSQTKARSSSHGWSVVSKLFQSKRVQCEAELNEFEKIDAELLVLKSSKDINSVQVQNTLKGLEALESTIQEAEEELEAVYRKLLKTRVTILNILSH